MKFAFSTLGCPGWLWDDIVSTAKDLNIDGIEIRGINNTMYAPKAAPFISSEIENTKARLRRLNLDIPCLTSSCNLSDKQNNEEQIKEAKDYIDCASLLGTPFIRVLGEETPEPTKVVDKEFVASNLKLLSNYAQDKKVMVLIETNGIFSNSDEMLNMIKAVNSANVGVLWDIHHPYRFMSEPVEKTWSTLKQHIKHIHIKDSIIENDKIRYKMMGYGNIPVKNALLMLKNEGFEGYVSLEWVKRWYTDLEEPGIVFSHFINYVRDIVK